MKSFKEHLLDEDLRKWFGKGKEGDWVRVGTDGEIKGECAREEGEGKPKCMPRSRAHGMDKDDRAKAARRKRREDPVADRKGKGGKPVMVATEETDKKATKADLYKAYSQGMKMTSGTAAHTAHLEKIRKMRKELRMDEETLYEKNVPTKPALWAKYKAQAKAKFDVYPSAYANGWASKMYKKAGGGWKSVSESLESKIAEACWSGYKQVGMKKKGKKVVPDCVPEEMVSVQPMDGPTGSMFAMKKEGKEHSWKSEGHYTKDGKEWTGPQHAHNGQVMTGEKHTADSQNLYHFKELPKDVKKKILDDMNLDESKAQARIDLEKYTKQFLKKGGKVTQLKPQRKKYRQGMEFGSKHIGSAREIDSTGSTVVGKNRKIHTPGSRPDIRNAKKEDIDLSDDPILEKLDATKNSIGDYVKDFKKSDAPQFKGKSSSKRRQMAIAAYLGSKRRDGERKLGEEIKYNSDMGAMDWGTPAGTDYMKDVTPGQKNPKEDPVKPLEQSTLKKLNVKDEYVREETEAGETKAEYRKDNAKEAPELGDYALTKQDIKELEHEADAITWEQAIELGMYDPDELEDDLNSADPHDEVNITEVLSVQGRLKRKFTARKNRQRLKVARGIALRRGSSPDRLKKRAQRGAKGMIYKRLLKGRDKSKLPPAEKGRLEKLIGMYAPLVSRLAQRMLPGMRKLEINRMKNRKGGAQKAKKYKAAKPTAKKQTAKKFKIKR